MLDNTSSLSSTREKYSSTKIKPFDETKVDRTDNYPEFNDNNEATRCNKNKNCQDVYIA